MPPRVDRYSDTWAAVSAWAADEIDEATGRLCAHGLSVVETEYQRGRIAALRGLLRLIEPPPQNIEVQDLSPDYHGG